MSALTKLQVKPDMTFAVLGCPPDVDLPGAATPETADAVLAFIERRSDLENGQARAVFEAATRDAVAWFAYPKAGQLGTDLNRDSLAQLVRERGLRPVRQVSINQVWSALRFRPA